MDRDLRDLYYQALADANTPPELRRKIRMNMAFTFIAWTALVSSIGVALLGLFCQLMCWYCGKT